MIKLMYALRRKPGMSREDFREYWQHRHAVTGVERRSALKSCRYIQNHRIDTPIDSVWTIGRSKDEPFDGVVECWFPSLEDVQATLATVDGRAAMFASIQDEANFIDLDRSVAFWVEEVEFSAPTPPEPST